MYQTSAWREYKKENLMNGMGRFIHLHIMPRKTGKSEITILAEFENLIENARRDGRKM